MSSNTVPEEIYLHQNYPNPFNSSTVIKYDIKNPSYVKIKLYNTEGKEIITLVSEYQNTGEYELLFDATELSNGVYYYSLLTNNLIKETKKLLLIK